MTDEQPDYEHYFGDKPWTPPPPAPAEYGLDRSVAANAKRIRDFELALDIAANPEKYSTALDAARNPDKYTQPEPPSYDDYYPEGA